jgi:thioesterase domain-containing protein
VQAQALEVDQPALLRMEDMAAHYLTEIRRVQPKGPYHLLGYSFGGVVVLEMAHQLLAAGETVGLLGMLDTRARDYIESTAPQVSSVDGRTQAGGLAGFFRSFVGHGSAKGWWKFFLNDLQERRVRYTITIAARTFSTLPPFLKNTHEINSVAARNYKVKPLSGRLTLFRAANQADSSIPSDNGWSPIFNEGVEVHEIPGDHWQVLSGPGIDVLAKSIHGCLSRFDESTG